MPLVKREVILKEKANYFWRKDKYKESTTWRTPRIIESKAITSLFHDTRYQPGSFKLTNVLLSKSSNDFGVVRSYVYGGSPAYRIDFEHNWITGNYKTVSFAETPWTSSLDDMLVRSAAVKAREDSVGLAETLRESGTTLRMLAKPFNDMRKLLVNKVLHNRSGKRRTAKAASSAWLEYRYGWMPLYYTAQALWDFKPLQTNLAKKGSKVMSVNDESYRWLARFTNPLSFSHLLDVRVRFEETFRGQFHYLINDLDLYNAVQRGTTLFNLPAYMWELTQLSFVIDWWYDVGTTIKLLTPAPYISMLGATTSRKLSRVETVTPTHTSPYEGNGPFTPGGADTVIRSEVYQRKIYTRSVTPPSLDLNFNSYKHAVDALSLILQRIL